MPRILPVVLALSAAATNGWGQILNLEFKIQDLTPAVAPAVVEADVLVLGGGTGGIAAALQSARLGARTVVAEPLPWLGGMLSSAGVSATDGNHRLPSGLWREFRQRLYDVYGGPEAVATGWVSHTHFEPHVAARVFAEMAAAEPSLRVLLRHRLVELRREGAAVRGAVLEDADGRPIEVRARIVVDGTDLGDVLARAGAAFDVGLEADSVSGEKAGVTASSDVVQDLTVCAVLKDYGPGADRTIPRPAGYDPSEFDCSSTSYCRDASRPRPTVDARKMLDYARLPNGKVLLNWPIFGNDTYLNVVALDEAAREGALEAARARTLRFVYFVQHELGFRNLGLAKDEFPTEDRLALLPYHREGRRLRGVVRFTARDIEEPFGAGRDPLYRTGISVGDYPIDHHHKRNPEAPQHLWFYPVPSFSVPLGALVPAAVDGLVVADKAISVTNVANGTTRLQPVVLLTGQAAGALAALAAKQGREPRAVPVRDVQRALLAGGAMVLPYLDVPPDHPLFARIQRIGAAGILKGHGVPHQWANQTWFYPDFPLAASTLQAGLLDLEPVDAPKADGRPLAVADAVALVADYRAALLKKDAARFARLAAAPAPTGPELWQALGLGAWDPARLVTRGEAAAVVDALVDPFELKAVDHRGRFVD